MLRLIQICHFESFLFGRSVIDKNFDVSSYFKQQVGAIALRRAIALNFYYCCSGFVRVQNVHTKSTLVQ